MINFTTGDLLKSDSQALVNTVNCEGYMGKGIAYQFKQKFPQNNLDYVRACKTGELKVGKLHYYTENNKIIINFPTKDKWRANSKIEYIEDGLDELMKLITDLNIKSVAIPPLGSGNGGLIWSEVKELIISKLSVFDENVQIFLYEPSKNYEQRVVSEPKMSPSALVLLEIKKNLDKFDTTRLQKTAFFIDIFSNQNYFNFKKYRYGPYDYNIAIISKKIKEFQNYYCISDVEDVYQAMYKKMVSDKVETKMKTLKPFILEASCYVNTIKTNHELECLSTITFLIDKKNSMSKDEILRQFKLWSEDKAKRFSDDDILNGIENLRNNNIIEENMIGFSINHRN
ncbi:macro domain-containing protein [Eubacteriaceae bacterium ES2]|nr:macro domain-containing protein [Eubacteriaceae bacterium ES2]